MLKTFALGFLVGGLLFVGGVVGFNNQKDENQKYEEEKLYQKEIGDATPVEFGILSEKQRSHSKLYNGFRKNESEQTISELIAPYRGIKMVYGLSIMVRRMQEFSGPEIPEDYFGKLAQESDAIILGKAIRKTSQITEDEKFLFTDYEVAVSEVLKNNAIAPFNIGTTVVVTSPGGKVVIADVIVKAEGNGMVSLPINDQNIVLFLKFIPETEGYKLTRYNAGFKLDGISVRPLVGYFPPEFLKNENSFLKLVRKVSNR